MNRPGYLSILFLVYGAVCFCGKANRQREFVRLTPSNLRASSDHRFQDLEIWTIDVLISNDFPDTIWIYKENDYLICSFDFYYYHSSGEYFRDDYAPHSPMYADFFPIPPVVSRNYKAEYVFRVDPNNALQRVFINIDSVWRYR